MRRGITLHIAARTTLYVFLTALSLDIATAEVPIGAQPGDLIFREGTEPISAAVRITDGGRFSHVGMLTGEPDNWRVVHATPPEMEGRADGVVSDTLAFFIDPVRSRRHEVYRVEADIEQRATAVTYMERAIGTPFRVNVPGGTYCTLLVWEAWRNAGVDLNVEFTTVTLPLLAGEYLLPSDLLVSERLEPIQGGLDNADDR